MFFRILIRPIPRNRATLQHFRSIATLDGNPHIYIHPDPRSLNRHVLSLLPDPQPHHDNNPSLAIGTTSTIPPTPTSLIENPTFLKLLHSVLSEHAFEDASMISQAQALASSGGSNLGSGGAFFPQQQRPHRRFQAAGGAGGAGGDGAGGASSQGGAGGGGRGGYIHVYDHRNPPDYGRIPFPEDIFGSLEVDSAGKFVDGKGRYQESGSYRVLTRAGCLGLSPFLRDKLIQRLKSEGAKE